MLTETTVTGWGLVLGEIGPVRGVGQAPRLPTNVILDREGKVRFAEPNFYWASEEQITQVLEGLGVLRPTASSSPRG
jgi:hypothetical protein